MVRIIAILATVGAVLLAMPAWAQNRIEWRLENPFRLFKDAKDTALHSQIFAALSAGEREAPILAAERKLEAQFGGRGWAEGVVDHTCYDQDRNRYSACPDYILPKSHRVVASFVRARRFWNFFQESSFEENCNWRFTDPAGKLLKEDSGLCSRPMTFDVPYPEGGRLWVRTASGASPIPVDIKVRDILIVGLGDSFGAGEGNPDTAVKFDDDRDFNYGTVEIAATRRKEQLDGYPAREGKWRKIESREFQRERARWLDRECHRSLYSHQLRAALQLAVENPQRAITFVGLACSGAEIPQGLLLPKPVRECKPGDNFASPAQLSQLSEELCQSVSRGTPMPSAIINRMPELRRLSEKEMRITRCAGESERNAGLKRPIDLIFLSIGGNDIGFSPIVSDSMLGESSIYRRLGRQIGAVYGVDEARKRADLVKQRFEGLRLAMELFFRVRPDGGQPPVLLTGYPHMGYGADGLSACGGDKGLEVFPPFQLDAAKVGKAEQFTEELNKDLTAIAGRSWTYVNGFRADFRRHGLCAVNDGANETFGFPRRKNGVWAPFKPTQYLPYTPRQRWFRTPNDAFLTANMHADQISNFGANCSGLYTGAFKLLAHKHWEPFQVFLASSYGGAFHPTAEGQARIADEVAAAARAALDRSN